MRYKEPNSPSSSINSLHEYADNLADSKPQKGKGNIYGSPQLNKGYKQEAQTFKGILQAIYAENNII